MKPTQITELFANIKKTFVSFISILMFVALGVGIFLGISWVAPALQNAAEGVFQEGSFHNIQIQYVYGLTDDDLAKLSEVEGITDVEGTYQSFQTITVDSDRRTVKLTGMGERIDTLVLVDGVLPTKTDEIALDEAAAKRLGFGLGDVLTFASDATGDDPTAALASMNANATDTAGASGTNGATASADASASASAASPSASEAPAQAKDKDGMKYLNGSTYKVTALVRSPEYLAVSYSTYGFSPSVTGVVDLLGWVPSAAFDASAFQNGYPIANARCASLEGLNTYSAQYKDASAKIEQRVTELGNTLAPARYDALHDNAQKLIDEAEAKIADAQAQIADGEQKLADGIAELEAKRANGEAQLAEAYQLLLNYEAQLSNGNNLLAEARQKAAAAEQLLADLDYAKEVIAATVADFVERGNQAIADFEASAQTEEDRQALSQALDELGALLAAELQPYADKLGIDIPSVTHEHYFDSLALAQQLVANIENLSITFDGRTMTIGEARSLLAQARQQIADGEAQLAYLTSQLESGWARYYAGIEELQAAVAEAEQQIADGERKLAEAKAQVAENEPKLRSAKDQLAAMKKYSWTVLGRSSNIASSEVELFGDITTRLSFSMALLFVIVGLLVSYSAVSRIVHEQITQIGTKKALGLRSREITLSFLCYSAIAVLSGAIIGAIVGFTLVEGIIAKALGRMFVFGAYPAYFGIPLFLVVTAIELALVLGSTWLACRSILKKHAVELLRGEEPPKATTRFYEKWGIWEKLPLFTQTIVNNCVNDKLRVFSTIVGVAGCTALIVTAITLNNDVLVSYDQHYNDVYGYNDIAYVDPAVDGAIDKVERAVQEGGGTTAQVMLKMLLITLPDGDGSVIRLLATDDEAAFSRVYSINPIAGGPVDLSQDGVWLSQAYQEHYNAKVGDTLEVNAGDGVVHRIPILGFHEFMLTYHEMVMSRDFYEREFGTEFAPNVVLIDSDVPVGELSASLSHVEGFDSVVDDKKFRHGDFETFSSVSSAVVLIYLILSVLMAVVVLLNLDVMFVEEKKRELIVLMINGFSVKDAKRYIYNDSIVLTILGIVLGLVLGAIMGSVTVSSIEPPTACFFKGVDWIAIAVGTVLSAVLSALMGAIAMRRIPRFSLTDINKI